jgi:hypothetical protein
MFRNLRSATFLCIIDNRNSSRLTECPLLFRGPAWRSRIIFQPSHTKALCVWNRRYHYKHFSDCPPLNSTFRYIDDVLSINNDQFHSYVDSIYPNELEIKDATKSSTSASYLDVLLNINADGKLISQLYGKRDVFNFAIVNFPYTCSKIPLSPAYGVYISQLIRYARACSTYDQFLSRGRLLTDKLMLQGFLRSRLMSAFRRFYNRYYDLIYNCKLSLSHMFDMFHTHS